jgi:5-amino-6-(5-phosphoribosylamino)uracil reductase
VKGHAAVGEKRKVFEAFAARKTLDAERAAIHPLVTVEDRSGAFAFETVGTAWTRHVYDGPFHLAPRARVASGFSATADPGLPTISLVFVQSKDGNTGTDNPEELGAGATDKHFLYEGLSRVAADAVLAGATTAAGEQVFFSVWHPELVALRASLGLPRHPAQIVVTGRACINPDKSLIFNVPDVPVIVVGTMSACAVLAAAAVSRPWMHIVPMEGADLRAALRCVHGEFGIRRISCIGGRTTATALLDAGLVQDICLTTSAREGGEPETPFYTGQRPPVLDPIVRKRATDPDAPFVFEHLCVRRGR